MAARFSATGQLSGAIPTNLVGTTADVLFLWVEWPATLSANETLFNCSHLWVAGSGVAGQFRVLLPSGGIPFWTSAAGLFSADGLAHLIGVRYDGTQATNATRLRVWYDGVEVTAGGTFTGTMPATMGAGTPNTGPLRLGAFSASNLTNYDGCLHHVAYYAATLLTPADMVTAHTAGFSTSFTALFGQPSSYWLLESDFLDTGSAPNNLSSSGTAPTFGTCAAFATVTLTIDPATLPGGAVGAPYNETLTATGGSPGTYTWSLSAGSLPPGLTLDTGTTGTTTTISGVPTTIGTYNFTVRADGPAGATGTRAYTVTIIYLAADPPSDTTRGGGVVVLSSNATLLDVSADRTLLGPSLPAGWSSVLAGSGLATPRSSGLELDTRLTAASSAYLASVATFTNFDVAVDVELEHPSGATAGVVDLAVLEARSTSGGIARVLLRRGFGADPALTVGFGDTTGPAALGSAVDATGMVTLRIVRNGARVWGFVGIRDDEDAYVALIPVLEYDRFPADAGIVRFGLGNGGQAIRVRAHFTNLTFRSHVRIGTRLVEAKTTPGARRIAGIVPAALVEEIGAEDVTVFGLFGSYTRVDGFVYVYPPERTVSRESTRTLFVVQDPALKDGV